MITHSTTSTLLTARFSSGAGMVSGGHGYWFGYWFSPGVPAAMS